jgi:serine/threonine protein kinase
VIGRTVNHFRIEASLDGGMSLVYKAEDTTLHRSVVLKVLPQGLAEERNQRFLREIRAISRFEHPNICSIYEIGNLDDGRPYLVLPFYEGETLEERLVIGRLSIEDAISICRGILKGLTRAHSEGIVHRDIKPTNVFITRDEQIKILDFGLALIESETRITQPGATVGTPKYMSPEQIRGEDIDFRTDLWSVGIVLHELLAGRSPFSGAEYQAIFHSILTEEPESITEIRPEVPHLLAQLLAKLLTKSPSARPSAVEALRMLDECEHSDQPQGAAMLEPTLEGIGIVAPLSYWSTDYYVDIIRSIRKAADREKQNFQRRFIVMDVSKEHFAEVEGTLTEAVVRNLEGLILVNMRMNKQIRAELTRIRIPVIHINHEDRSYPSACSILHDLSGFHDLLDDAMIKKRPKAAVLITKPVANPFKGVKVDLLRKQKREIFQTAASSIGLRCAPATTLKNSGSPIPILAGEAHIVEISEYGPDCGHEVFNCCRSAPPSTLFVFLADVAAIGFLLAAEREGVTLAQRDMRVTGFDDIPAADWFGLSSVNYRLDIVGRIAYQQLQIALDSRDRHQHSTQSVKTVAKIRRSSQ